MITVTDPKSQLVGWGGRQNPPLECSSPSCQQPPSGLREGLGPVSACRRGCAPASCVPPLLTQPVSAPRPPAGTASPSASSTAAPASWPGLPSSPSWASCLRSRGYPSLRWLSLVSAVGPGARGGFCGLCLNLHQLRSGHVSIVTYAGGHPRSPFSGHVLGRSGGAHRHAPQLQRVEG